MRGYCKCDLCGSLYNETENATYNGITVWWKDNAGDNMFPMLDAKLCTQSGELIDDMPAVMDICPNCFDRFYNWIRMARNEAKSPINDKDFPMNKPE